jgi:hypothetical protein
LSVEVFFKRLIISGIFFLFSQLLLHIVGSSHLEEDGKNNQAAVDDAHQETVEAIKEADVCINCRSRARLVA